MCSIDAINNVSTLYFLIVSGIYIYIENLYKFLTSLKVSVCRFFWDFYVEYDAI